MIFFFHSQLHSMKEASRSVAPASGFFSDFVVASMLLEVETFF